MGSKHWLDEIKVRIYEDYLQSIARVRDGCDPEVMFREHERRVAPLRAIVDATERATNLEGAPLRRVQAHNLSKSTTSRLHA